VRHLSVRARGGRFVGKSDELAGGNCSKVKLCNNHVLTNDDVVKFASVTSWAR
jgi:hypothetical protein